MTAITQRLALEDGLFEIEKVERGEDQPLRLWARSCSTRACECRSALVLATTRPREELLRSAARLHDVWLAGGAYVKELGGLSDGVLAFTLDIDTAEASFKGDPLDLEQHPELRAIVERIDGEMLDAMGRLWYLGKGLPDPEAQPQPVATIYAWKPWATVGWDEAYLGVREDLYILHNCTFRAIEMYCVNPSCHCGIVAIQFDRGLKVPRDLTGTATVDPSCGVVLKDATGHRGLVGRLFRLFESRHPRYRERFAWRHARMKEFGKLLVAYHGGRSSIKTARNDPCACGSGKKYKRCCAVLPPSTMR